MILPADAAESIAAAAARLRAGGLLGLPTETVYGLAANADDDAAVAQIFRAKGRPADHPLIVHLAGASAVAHYAAEVPEFARQLMQAFWPGPLTLILPRRPGIANAAAGGNPTIGLRCPSHPLAQALLKALMDCRAALAMTVNSSEPVIARSEATRQSIPLTVFGLAAPSANQFGRVSPTTAAHVQAEFGDELLILDGGACSVGIESSIIDCTRGQPVLLRPGAITPKQVWAACGLKMLSKEELSSHIVQTPKASGTLESHYAPRAKVRLMSTEQLRTAVMCLGSGAGTSAKPEQPALRPTIALYCRTPIAAKSPQVLVRRMPASAGTAAQELFAALRAFDDQAVKLIWVESPPETPEWDGVRDRLQRAAN